MVDLPSVETVATGGIIGGIIGGATWLVKRFAGAITVGEDLADRRIAALLRDMSEYRTRAEAEIAALHTELDEYRAELTAAREGLRRCESIGHNLRLEVDRLRAEVARLQPGL